MRFNGGDKQMSSAEVMNEIAKLPLAEKRRVLAALAEQLSQTAGQTDLDSKEERFVNGLKQKGLITEMPQRLPDDELRQNYQRIEVRGEPLSETIVKERG